MLRRNALLTALITGAISIGGCALDQADPSPPGGSAAAVASGGTAALPASADAAAAPAPDSAPSAVPAAVSASPDAQGAAAGTGTPASPSTPATAVAPSDPALTTAPATATTTAGTTGATTADATGPATTPPTSGATATSTPPPPSPPAFRGDGSPMPSFGGWAWGSVPAAAVAKAGFEWFETGYPGDSASNDILRGASIRPFAYINLGELDPTLAADARYTGPVLRTNADWGTQLVDVTHPSWQDWLLRRTEYAYSTGSRGVKWDVATPDVPPGKTRADVNDAIAAVMKRILQAHPDLKFIFNQGFEFGLAYPQLVHGIETEGLFSASSYPSAFLQPWLDPWYWGPQYQQVKALHDKGIPVFCAEYADPAGDPARQLYAAIVGQGFVPYITSDHWNVRGWGYHVPPGW
jgi:polysaccharide biosynthesis protein PelA